MKDLGCSFGGKQNYDVFLQTNDKSLEQRKGFEALFFNR
ncbi:hypothetical protein FHS60_001213 [Alloprevotella rava]|uniref:Uncharacterized protein n=1 Tax=Alloprevotella rava TaxID=671218 RepID=A0A7W5YDZ0_9BACT|nr:hypothetical protein [Alloprevotella rava]